MFHRSAFMMSGRMSGERLITGFMVGHVQLRLTWPTVGARKHAPVSRGRAWESANCNL